MTKISITVATKIKYSVIKLMMCRSFITISKEPDLRHILGSWLVI